MMLNQIEVTILSENRVVNPLLIAENGLCLHVATAEGNFLFDTGHRDHFLQNAHQLQIDLSDVKQILLSHSHFDHSGGLYYYLQAFHQASVICHPNLFHKKYRLVKGQRLDISIPYEEDELKAMGTSFLYKSHPHHLSENILSTGEIPRVDDYERVGETYQERVLESYMHDELHDDMAMVLKTINGLIILLGCAHSGPINTIKYAMRLTGINRVYAVMGGMHLTRASSEKIERIGHGLQEINPQYIIPLHCTGFRAIDHIYKLFGERVLLYNVGDVLTLNVASTTG